MSHACVREDASQLACALLAIHAELRILRIVRGLLGVAHQKHGDRFHGVGEGRAALRQKDRHRRCDETVSEDSSHGFSFSVVLPSM